MFHQRSPLETFYELFFGLMPFKALFAFHRYQMMLYLAKHVYVSMINMV